MAFEEVRRDSIANRIYEGRRAHAPFRTSGADGLALMASRFASMREQLLQDLGLAVNAQAVNDRRARVVEAQHFHLGSLAAQL